MFKAEIDLAFNLLEDIFGPSAAQLKIIRQNNEILLAIHRSNETPEERHERVVADSIRSFKAREKLKGGDL